MTSVQRRTKIVTTLGPSTDKGDNLEAIIKSGANVVRMNFSHGTAEDHKLRAKKYGKLQPNWGNMSPSSAICKVLRSEFRPLKTAALC